MEDGPLGLVHRLVLGGDLGSPQARHGVRLHEHDIRVEAPGGQGRGALQADVSTADNDRLLGGAHGVVQRECVGVVADVVHAGEGPAHGCGELEGGTPRSHHELVIGNVRAGVRGECFVGQVRAGDARAQHHLHAVGVVPLLRLALSSAPHGGVEAGKTSGALLVQERLRQRGTLVGQHVLSRHDAQVRTPPGCDHGAGEVARGVAAAHHHDLLRQGGRAGGLGGRVRALTGACARGCHCAASWSSQRCVTLCEGK
mmetsp:Transcript_844/g.1942  ORF Transcript_844/g.1942 Transcript_844/m.1942 type:complete len:256 (+) Transcript_844:916-1683(+)